MFQTAFDRHPLVIIFRMVELFLLLLILFSLGMGISTLGDRRPVLPGPPPGLIEPRPTPPEPVLGSIPLFDGKVTLFSFFTKSPGDPSVKPINGDHFSKNEARFVYGLIHLEYPPAVKSYDYQLEFTLYRNGEIFSTGTGKWTIPIGSKESFPDYGFGWNDPGHFLPGHFYMVVYYQGTLIANGAFEIYP